MNQPKLICQTVICTDPGECVKQPPYQCPESIPALGMGGIALLAVLLSICAKLAMIRGWSLYMIKKPANGTRTNQTIRQ